MKPQAPYALLGNDCFIRLYQLFCYKFSMSIIINLVLHVSFMLSLCLILSVTCYAQNNAGIIGRTPILICISFVYVKLEGAK